MGSALGLGALQGKAITFEINKIGLDNNPAPRWESPKY